MPKLDFTTYKNTKIAFTSQGKGSVIVLLHGFLENLTMWDAISNQLSKKYRVICIDLLGHGQTESIGYVHTMAEQAAMVKAVLNKLKLRKYVIVGHSMGGYVALSFADLYPNNIKGLCLLNSTSLADSAAKKRDRNRAINLVKQNHTAFIKTAIPMLFSEKNRKVLKVEISNTLKQALATSKQGVIAALEGMKMRKDLTLVLNNKDLKSLVFIGTYDTTIDTKALLKVYKSTTNKQLVTLPDAHMGHIESEKEVLKYLSTFARFCFK